MDDDGVEQAEDERFMEPLCAEDPRRDAAHYELSEQPVGERYLLMHGIGSGKYGKVYEARDVVAMRPVAVKVMPRSPHIDQKKAEREWVIASKLQHRNVIRLCDVQLSSTHMFLVLELASGRALYDAVSKVGGLDEGRARRIASQIFSGISYCHAQGVSHRDLKLENLLLMSQTDGEEEDTVKITDFGLSKDSLMSNCKTLCGTLSYMAPEVANVGERGMYDGPKVDIWSLGVILYVMRCCSYPFGHDGAGLGTEPPLAIFNRIKVGELKSPVEFAQRCSPELQSLIRGMLTVEPERRVTLEQILAHPWLGAGGGAGGPGGGAAGGPERPPAVGGAAAAAGAGGDDLGEGLTVQWPPIAEEILLQAEEPHADGDGGLGDSWGGLESLDSLGSDDADQIADMPVSYDTMGSRGGVVAVACEAGTPPEPTEGVESSQLADGMASMMLTESAEG